MIDEELQAQLREKYNPDGSPLRVHQLKMLDMLEYFDTLCKANNIKYWLSSGTCLGAIRHGGFIPWDDDIDIEMLRDDYIKLEKVFLETNEYVLQTWKNDKYYCLPFAKMRDKSTVIYNSLFKYKGVFIDILVLERTPKILSQIAYFCRRILWKSYCIVKHRNKYSMLFFLLKFLLFYLLIPVCRLLSKMFSNLEGNVYRHSLGTGWIDNIRIIDEILPTINVTFEGIKFPVPQNYDKYLSRMYGDYMKIPEESNMEISHVEFFVNSL